MEVMNPKLICLLSFLSKPACCRSTRAPARGRSPARPGPVRSSPGKSVEVKKKKHARPPTQNLVSNQYKNERIVQNIYYSWKVGCNIGITERVREVFFFNGPSDGAFRRGRAAAPASGGKPRWPLQFWCAAERSVPKINTHTPNADTGAPFKGVRSKPNDSIEHAVTSGKSTVFTAYANRRQYCGCFDVFDSTQLLDKNHVDKDWPFHRRLRGATVARLTPDQKVACSNHVGVNCFTQSG